MGTSTSATAIGGAYLLKTELHFEEPPGGAPGLVNRWSCYGDATEIGAGPAERRLEYWTR
jgi:hypothetical protein